MKSQTIEIKERPILFNTEMVKAVLEGRKTQTRRVINPQIDPHCLWGYGVRNSDKDNFSVHGRFSGKDKWIKCPYGKPGDKEWQTGMIPNDGFYYVKGLLDKSIGGDERLVYLRKQEDFITWGFNENDDPEAVELDTNITSENIKWKRPGDRLWVRETWQITDFLHPSDENYGYIYKASENGEAWESNEEDWTWKRSIHMPRAASRILLEITDIRVERVQQTLNVDALAEGIQSLSKDGNSYKYGLDGWKWSDMSRDPRNAFKTLWDSINAKRGYGWEVNPWVWVVEFRKI